METWVLSVKQWKNIVSILESLNIPTKISFSSFSGHHRTNLYRNAEKLSRKKIPPTHRGKVRQTIKKIKRSCRDKCSNEIIKINISQSVCNTIKSIFHPT